MSIAAYHQWQRMALQVNLTRDKNNNMLYFMNKLVAQQHDLHSVCCHLSFVGDVTIDSQLKVEVFEVNAVT